MVYSPNVSTTPITAMGCWQCSPLSVVQLKGKHCRKPNCRNGVIDMFGHWGSSWKPNNPTDITRQKLRTVRQSRKSYMLVYLEQQRFKACLRRCQVVQNRVLFENVLGMRMLLLSGSEASNTCSNMHTIPFSPDMAGPQGKFCPFSSVFTPTNTIGKTSIDCSTKV